ncbi:hypothetical protein [Streptomyces synnematoformans]|uniref:Uncharacterized protein n=1 Tax=Streptomyces synnematoformans TaxID=415721 RepID=A0ABN2X9E3_9ACTN
MSALPHPASAELLQLAAATRPDWAPADVSEALAAAHAASMTWPQVLAAMGRLMADPEALPADLVQAAPQPWRPGLGPADPEHAARAAATARQGIRRRLAAPPTEPTTSPDRDENP